MDPEALRWRQIPWNKIPQDSRADVLPFLPIKDNLELDIALLNDEECHDDYLLSHKNKKVCRPTTTGCTRKSTTSKACAG